MADRGIKDVVIGIIMLIFFIGAFSAIIVSFDNEFVNSEGYGANLNTTYNNVSSDYKESDKELQQNLLNGSSFSVSSSTDIDTRGFSEVAIIAKNSPGTIRNFLNLAGQYLLLHWTISLAISMLIIAIIGILFIKVFVERKL